MYKFLQRNNKKLLAVFMVGLMIVFILPTTPWQGAHNPLIGHYGDTELYAEDFQRADAEWEAVKSVTISGAAFGVPDMNLPLMALGPPNAAQIESDPHLYLLLLQEEAKRLGVVVTAEQVEEILVDVARLPTDTDPAKLQAMRNAIEHLMMVKIASDRALSVVKISEPMQRRALAQLHQTLELKFVPFSIADVMPEITTPSEERIKAQFDKYADVLAGGEGMGFGYRVPDRVKIQYVRVPMDAVKASVRLKRTDYEWEVEARKMYNQHPEYYQTRPEVASTQPSTRPATAPTTRPFVDVQVDIREQLIEQEAAELAEKIQEEIVTTLATDWSTYRRTPVGSTSTLGVPYNSYEYLQKLAEYVQKRTGVLPIVTSKADEYTPVSKLEELPDIGKAQGARGGIAGYVQVFAEAFVDAKDRNDSRVLSNFEPSTLFTDQLGDYYFFRLTDVQLAQKQSDLEAVRAQIVQDLRDEEAFGKMREKANEFLAKAKESTLEAAAETVGRSVLESGPLQVRPNATVPSYPLPNDASNEQFILAAFKMLTEVEQTKNEHPQSLLEVPAARTIFAARLEKISAPWNTMTLPLIEQSISRQMIEEAQSQMRVRWFDRDAVLKRTGFQLEEVDEEPQKPEDASRRPTAPGGIPGL